MIVRLSQLLFKGTNRPQEIDRQLANLEPLAPLTLGVHGLTLLLFMGGRLWQWPAIGGVLLLGIWALSKQGKSKPAILIRAGLIFSLAWLLLLTSGGVGSFFLLWYFILIAVYPLLLPSPLALILIGAVSLSYLLLWPFSTQPLPLIVVLTRVFLLAFLGWFTWALGSTLLRYALEHIRAERALFESNTHLERAQAQAKLGSWVLYPEIQTGTWSKQMFVLFGLDPADGVPIFQEFLQLVHPEDQAQVVDTNAKVIQTGQTYAVEYRTNPTHGPVRYMLATGYGVLDAQGQLLHVAGTVQDITERKQAEETLRMSEANLRITLDSIGDAVIVTNLQGTITRMNPVAVQLTGWPVEEARHKLLPEVFNIINSQTGEAVQNPVEKVIDTGKIVGLANHTSLIARDGTAYHIADSGAPIIDSAGNINGVVLVFRDVSEAYRIEQALKESEERLRLVFNNTSDLQQLIAVEADGQFRILSVNEAHVQTARQLGFNVSRRDFIGKTVEEISLSLFGLSQDRLAETLSRFRQVVTSSQSAFYEQSAFMPLGRYHIEVTLAPVLDEKGICSHILWSARNVTRRKQVEEQLELTQFGVDHSQIGVYRIDEKGHIRYANQYACRSLGYTVEELLNLTIWDIDVNFNQASWQAHRKHSRSQHMVSLETSHRRKDGTIFPVEVTVSFIEFAGERISFSFVKDITERKQLEEQLLQSQKMEAIGHLAGGIAHDFNNILVPIIGYAELGLNTSTPESMIYAGFEQIKKAADRAADITRQILAFSRKQVLEMRVLEMNTVVEDFERMIDRLLGETIELQTRLSSELHRVKADKTQIEQVLMNLVVNARDAMPQGGKLIIETANAYLDEAYIKEHADTQAPGNYVMLAVSDNGQGMDAATRQQIFEPFFTTKERGKGVGLGLATVFGIIKQHQGHIWVYSEPGQGTTFKIYLPWVEEARQADQVPAVEPASAGGTETILVVEDDEMVRQLVCDTLTAFGYHVLETNSPADCLQRAEAYPEVIHLLLTDVIMPGMTGLELYQQVAALRPDIHILYMSGYTDNVIVHHGILDEGVNFLAKPFTIRDLTQKVKSVLG